MKASYLDLDEKQLNLLKAILKQKIPDKTVWAYGSRVKKTAGKRSDLDLVVFDCNGLQILDLKTALEESSLLFSIDVMSWEQIPQQFKIAIHEQYIVLQSKK